ncbi:Alpha/Beta hydrolase protein [Aspergillus heterothallicus]
MNPLAALLASAVCLIARALSAPESSSASGTRQDAPTVHIAHPAATIIGIADTSNIESFNGIPYAEPPTGPLRLKPPHPLRSHLGTIHATAVSPSCPQFAIPSEAASLIATIPAAAATQLASSGTMPGPASPPDPSMSEDCLTLDIRRPGGITAGDDLLPVLVWSTAAVVFVAMNYRVGGFGFLPGREILEDGAANLGVTIWGQSSGGMLVFDQMVLFDGDNMYKGRPLFQGAIMSSGGVLAADPVDGEKGQAIYNAVVAAGGCSTSQSNHNTDTLACLRSLPYETFHRAVSSVPGPISYQSSALSYIPRPDGRVLTASPDVLAQTGRYARVPFIAGSQEDEGTIFALFQGNITSTDEIVLYLSTYYFHNATREQLAALVLTYTDISTDGSPFRTGPSENWYPQFKRLAAVLGDVTFTLSRRALLQTVDIAQVFYGIPDNYAADAMRRYLLSFVYDLDPNSRRGGLVPWPAWGAEREMMWVFADRGEVTVDGFREEAFAVLESGWEAFRM